MGLFDFFKKQPAEPAQPASVPVTTQPNTLYAPVSGRVVAMSEVPDPVFSGEVLGKGCAFWPDEDVVYSPVDGTISVTMGHAVGINTEDGIEILVHVGVDTVNMQGDGFTSYAEKGSTVKAGDPVIGIDREKIKAAGYPDCVVLAVSNSATFANVAMSVDADSHVSVGDPVVTITR